MFQLTLHKNLNAYPRILGLPSHTSLHVTPRRAIQCVFCLLAITRANPDCSLQAS